MMLNFVYTVQTILFLQCILWAKVFAQCNDPLIYRLDDIRQLIANLTAKQERENAELKSIIRNLTEKLEAQEQLKTGWLNRAIKCLRMRRGICTKCENII